MNKFSSYVLSMIVTLFAVSANGAPMAYSINTDSGKATADSLFSIDLSTGVEQRKGELFTGIATLLDTEGLAFSPSGTLWGIDDDSRTLFPISQTTGGVRFTDVVPLAGFPAGGGNDFGMTFSCDGSLYVTSVVTQTLYRLNLLDGSSEVIGGIGALGVNISAIAAFGRTGKLFGLGNGQLQDGTTDDPNLYSIDVTSGVATLIGPLGTPFSEYGQGGLAFDSQGRLWAITDRSIINNSIANQPSQILRINTGTGAATLVSETTETGFESLAIAPPSACSLKPLSALGPQPIPALGPIGLGFLISLLLLIGFPAKRQRLP